MKVTTCILDYHILLTIQHQLYEMEQYNSVIIIEIVLNLNQITEQFDFTQTYLFLYSIRSLKCYTVYFFCVISYMQQLNRSKNLACTCHKSCCHSLSTRLTNTMYIYY